MTETEMRKRMKEIDEERHSLSLEKKKYEEYFYNKKIQDRLKAHEEYVGKCYMAVNGLADNKEGHVVSFKILKVLDKPNENYALCVALIDGNRYTCWNEYGIQIMTLGLWTPGRSRMSYSLNDPNVIDFYQEISQEEFQRLYIKHSNNINSRL